MSPEQRDKPPAPRRRKIPKVAYVVNWDPVRSRFVALDDGGAVLGLSHMKGAAIDIARIAAMKAAKQQRAAVSVMVEDDYGKLKKQWTFAPPGKGHG